MNEIKKDTNLREAVRRREQKQPSMPVDLNERLLQRLEAQEATSKRSKLPLFLRWTAAAAMLAGICFLGIRFGEGETASQLMTEEPPVAEAVEPAPPVVQNEHTGSQETLPQAAEKTTASKRSHLRKQKTKLQQVEAKTTASVEEPPPKDSTPPLLTTADSLYYYLTKLEEQMGDCRDSVCLSELGSLIRADERIKGLVQKIIHKQVETAYKEEYLVDTTTRYIPL